LAGKLDSDAARKNIEFARVRRGLSRDELAKEAEIPARSFANFLGGSQNLIEEKIGRVALVLGVTYDDLFDVAFEHKFKAGLAISKTSPTQSAPALRESITADRVRLIEAFDRLNDGQQRAVLVIVEAMAGDGVKGVTYTPER